MIKTTDELDALKESWAKDPCWDIERTEGFEEHLEELLQFKMEKEAEWKARDVARLERRVAKFKAETGIDDPLIADELSTFSEIERDLKLRTAEGENASSFESAHLEVLRAQVRATLLLAAQGKRLADLLEESLEEARSESNLGFMVNLHKVD